MRNTLVDLTEKIKTTRYKKHQLRFKIRHSRSMAYLANNALREGVRVLPNGLQYKVIKPGYGRIPKATDEVSVHYEGMLIDGTRFGGSLSGHKPVKVHVDKTIAAWSQALQLMEEGAQWQLFVPPELGYGDNGPLAQQTLLFTLELLAVNETVT